MARDGLKKVAIVSVAAVIGLVVIGTQMRHCEVERSEAWHRERSRQTEICAAQCNGPFEVLFEYHPRKIRCQCLQND